MSLLHDQCQASLHWGKAGWPQLEPCYDGSQHLPETWCQFGCAVQVTLHLLTALEHITLPFCAMVQIIEQVTLHSLIAPEYIADLCCKVQDVSMQSTAKYTLTMSCFTSCFRLRCCCSCRSWTHTASLHLKAMSGIGQPQGKDSK